MIMKKFGAIWLAALAGVVLLVEPASGAASCTGGVYNYRQSASGACAWGNVRVRVVDYFRIDAVVVDTAADGRCADLQIKTERNLTWDAIDHYKVCGKGASRPVNETYDYSLDPIGNTNAWHVRVCATTCSTWKVYRVDQRVG